jgi:hypothetical protein
MNMSVPDFLGLTRYEFYIKRKERDKSEIQRINEQRAQAWWIARMTRFNPFPELDDILIQDSKIESTEMTDDQMMQKAKMLNAMYGGDFVEV